MAFQIVGTAFANATTISIPAHQAGDVIVIHAWRNDSATPPTRPSGWLELLSGASGTFSHRVGWREATDSSTVSGTWTGATRLAVIVARDGFIDEAIVDNAGSSSSDDFFWGPGAGSPFLAPRRVVLVGENNATYVGAAAHTVPTGYTLVNSVTDQGSVIHLSDEEVTVVDAFVSLTSSGGTPGYRTLTLPFVASDITATMAVTETGSDSFSGTGGPIVSGSLAVSETGTDTFAGSGEVQTGVAGILSVSETGLDVFAGTGGVLVTGTFAATETGTDTAVFTGLVVSGSSTGEMAATESGLDSFLANGFLSVVDEIPSTPGVFRFLLEDNSSLLLEVGSTLILETQQNAQIQTRHENTARVEAVHRTVYIRPGSPT